MPRLMAMGAYTTAILSKALAPIPFFAATGLHIWLGVVLGTCVAAGFGALLAFPALRVRGPYLAMVTIAFGWVIFKILQEWVSVTGGDLGLASIPKAQIGPWQLGTQEYYYVVLAMFALALVLQRRIVELPFGMRLRAMKHSEIGIASVGINVYRLKVTVFIVSAAFAGFGGALFAHQQNYVSPDNFQFFSSVFFLLAILFGGAGTLSGHPTCASPSLAVGRSQLSGSLASLGSGGGAGETNSGYGILGSRVLLASLVVQWYGSCPTVLRRRLSSRPERFPASAPPRDDRRRRPAPARIADAAREQPHHMGDAFRRNRAQIGVEIPFLVVPARDDFVGRKVIGEIVLPYDFLDRDRIADLL